MPNIWMHLEYGQQLAEEFSGRFPFLTLLNHQQQLYNLGCQGPDFLLYHSFLPWSKDIGALRLGDLMHTESCGPVLIDFWKATLSLEGTERAQAQLYFLGFLTHHLLDRNLHPYINWKAGYKYRDHQRFEIDLDTLFMSRRRSFRTWKHPAWSRIDAGRRLPGAVHRILHAVALEHYPEAMDSLPREIWQSAYRDMVLAQRCLYDPLGWKKAITWGRTRRMFSRKLTAREERLDYLNEQHAEWRHPALYSEVRTESVWDLWEAALAEGRVVLGALADWLDSAGRAAADRNAASRYAANRGAVNRDAANRSAATSLLGAFTAVLGNRSYDTGKDCSLNLHNQYADPIWTSLPGG